MALTDEFQNYTGGIFIDTTGKLEIDHYVTVVGWGIENRTKYWFVKNSRGSHWGEKGFFKIIIFLSLFYKNIYSLISHLV